MKTGYIILLFSTLYVAQAQEQSFSYCDTTKNPTIVGTENPKTVLSDEEMFKLLNDSLTYVSGELRFTIQMPINCKGELGKPKIMGNRSSVGYAKRIAKILTNIKWIPGKIGDDTVDFEFWIPILIKERQAFYFP